MPYITPVANKSDRPPSIGKPTGGGGAPPSSGSGGPILECAAKLKSIKLKHNKNTLTFLLFILGLNMR